MFSRPSVCSQILPTFPSLPTQFYILSLSLKNKWRDEQIPKQRQETHTHTHESLHKNRNQQSKDQWGNYCPNKAKWDKSLQQPHLMGFLTPHDCSVSLNSGEWVHFRSQVSCCHSSLLKLVFSSFHHWRFMGCFILDYPSSNSLQRFQETLIIGSCCCLGNWEGLDMEDNLFDFP